MPCFTDTTRKLLPEIRELSSRLHLPFRLSKSNKKQVQHLCETIHRCRQSLRPIQSTELRFEQGTSTSAKSSAWHEITQHPWYSSIPPPIRDILDMKAKVGRKYTFAIGSRKVAVYMVLPESDNPTYSRWFHSPHRFFEKAIQRIALWLSVAHQYGDLKCAKEFNVYLLFTDHKKLIPENHESRVSKKHANTAFVSSCLGQGHADLFLYRTEEWFKVFVHETFHGFGLDFSEMESPKYEHHFQRLFPGCSHIDDMSVFESYTETWAEIINVVFLAYFEEYGQIMGHKRIRGTHRSRVVQKTTTRKITQTNHHTARIVKKVESYLAMERVYSLIQMVKVLKHIGYSYREFCSNTDSKESNSWSNQPYLEETPVFAYYVLKAVLMYHANDFMEWIQHQPRPNRYSPAFTKTLENVESFAQFIESIYKAAPFLHDVAQAEKQIDGLSPTLDKTMRMSLYECE